MRGARGGLASSQTVRGTTGLGDKASRARPFRTDVLMRLQNGADLCNIIRRTPGQSVGGTARGVTAYGRSLVLPSGRLGNPAVQRIPL